MLRYLLTRVGSGVALLVVAATATFFLVAASGLSPVIALVGPNATNDLILSKEHELGLDRPVGERFITWVLSALHGDLGASWFTNEPVASALANRLPVTLSVVIFALVLSAVLSVVLGTLSAVYGGWLDRLLQVITIIGFAIPGFWLAVLLAVWLGVQTRIFPATGYVQFTQSPGGWLQSITLPAVSLAIAAISATAQQLRGAMIDVLQLAYIRTLRSRGIPEREILFRHVLRNAAAPSLTILGLQFIGLLGGTVLIERVFALPGLGQLTTDAANHGDTPVILGSVVITVIVVIVVNFVTDLLQALLNPKLRAA